MNETDSKNLQELLTTFDARALGESDESAGLNILASMAGVIADLAPADGTILTKDGRPARLGLNMLVTGPAITGLVVDEVLTVREPGLLLGVAPGTDIGVLNVLNPGVRSRAEKSDEALVCPFVGFEGGCRHIRFFLAKVFGEPVADGVGLQGLAACDFADSAQMFPGFGFRQPGGSRITDRLEEYFAILHAVGPVGSHSLQSHLFRIMGMAACVVDIRNFGF